jgi:hypothetical protein
VPQWQQDALPAEETAPQPVLTEKDLNRIVTVTVAETITHVLLQKPACAVNTVWTLCCSKPLIPKWELGHQSLSTPCRILRQDARSKRKCNSTSSC